MSVFGGGYLDEPSPAISITLAILGRAAVRLEQGIGDNPLVRAMTLRLCTGTAGDGG